MKKKPKEKKEAKCDHDFKEIADGFYCFRCGTHKNKPNSKKELKGLSQLDNPQKSWEENGSNKKLADILEKRFNPNPQENWENKKEA